MWRFQARRFWINKVSRKYLSRSWKRRSPMKYDKSLKTRPHLDDGLIECKERAWGALSPREIRTRTTSSSSAKKGPFSSRQFPC